MTSPPRVLIAIAVLDALLLIPVLSNPTGPLFAQYGFTPAHASLLTLWTGMFLHAGFWHYAGNMLFLWLFGRKVEGTIGHLSFAVSYLLCGAGGQALHFVLNRHSEIPCVGASGAIAGIVGMYLVLFPADRFDLNIYLGYWRVKTIASNTKVAVGVWIGEQFVLGLINSWVSVSSTAFWAHVGGFVAGMAIAGLYSVRVPAPSRPEVLVIEVPLDEEDRVPEPNRLTGLNLSGREE